MMQLLYSHSLSYFYYISYPLILIYLGSKALGPVRSHPERQVLFEQVIIPLKPVLDVEYINDLFVPIIIFPFSSQESIQVKPAFSAVVAI